MAFCWLRMIHWRARFRPRASLATSRRPPLGTARQRLEISEARLHQEDPDSGNRLFPPSRASRCRSSLRPAGLPPPDRRAAPSGGQRLRTQTALCFLTRDQSVLHIRKSCEDLLMIEGGEFRISSLSATRIGPATDIRRTTAERRWRPIAMRSPGD